MSSRPSAARRRFHTDRIIAKRLRIVRLLRCADDADLVRGRLDDEQRYLGCHRACCGLCHPHKRWSYGDRRREEREWRRYLFGAVRRARAAELAATADRISSLNAVSSSLSPSRMSMARRVFPSRLELNSL